MGINFKYVDYGQRLYDYVENDPWFRSEKNLFVFVDNRMKEIFIRKLGADLFSSTPTFLTMDEFKERIFITDKVILKEAKRILAFFKSIPGDVRSELEIENYFDIIDFANNFFAYYRELNISCNSKLENPHKWQKSYLDYFQRIKKNFDIFMEKGGYIASDWLEQYENFNGEWLKKYSDIIFVDIVEFSRLDVKILGRIGKDLDITLLLQMQKGDFDEENLKLGEVKVPKPDNITIYTFTDELQEAMTLIKFQEKRKISVYSPAVEENNFYQLFPNNFAPSRRDVMNDTAIFKFLTRQLSLLGAKEEKFKSTYLLSAMVEAFEDRTFCEYYDITKEDFMKLNDLLKNGYKYIAKSVIDDEFDESDWVLVSKINRIFYDLDEITAVTGVESLYEYLNTVIDMKKLFKNECDYDNGDIIEKIVEIFGMMRANERIGIYNKNSEIFGKRAGQGLYRLLLQYMKDIVIKSNIKVPAGIPLIKPLDFVKYVNVPKGNIDCFIDITDEYIPKITGDKLIFTEGQRKDMKMMTGDEKRAVERYRFFQVVCSGTNPVIFAKKDEESGIGPSPFLEEIISENSIEVKEIPVTISGTEKVMENIFSGERIIRPLNENESFQKKSSDFKDGRITLGAYDIGIIRECPVKFYFSKMRELEPVIKGEDKDLDPRILGIIVHRTLEILVKNMWKDVLSGKIEVDEEEIKRRLVTEFERARYMIQIHMDNYIMQILIPLLADNIKYFFDLLKKKYSHVEITRFQGEKSKYEEKPFYEGNINVNLTGRADLVIETDTQNTIIDYKTGDGDAQQLDYYNIILYGGAADTKKVIYNVWKREYREFDKEELKMEDVEHVARELSDSMVYAQAEKPGVCNKCIYRRVCRRGDQ